MNVHPSAPTDPDAFLRWNEGREGKRELVKGRVVEYVINVTRAHVRIVTRLLIELASKLDPKRFEAYTVDIGLKTPDGVRYPDLVVDVAGGDGKDLAVTAPVLVCEVLSPSSIVRDTVEKQRDYTGIPSLLSSFVAGRTSGLALVAHRRRLGRPGYDRRARRDHRCPGPVGCDPSLVDLSELASRLSGATCKSFLCTPTGGSMRRRLFGC
jgi:Putative restriction endonuclease